MRKIHLSVYILLMIILCATCTKQSSSDGVIPQGSSLNNPGTGGIQGSISPTVACTVEAILISTKASVASTVTDSKGIFLLKSLKADAYNLKITPVSNADLQHYGVHNWLQQIAVSVGANASTGIIPID